MEWLLYMFFRKKKQDSFFDQYFNLTEAQKKMVCRILLDAANRLALTTEEASFRLKMIARACGGL